MSKSPETRSRNGELRSEALAARRALGDGARANASRVIAEKLVRCHEFHAARSVACYLPMRDEVDVRGVIARAWRANKRVFCPVVTRNREIVFRNLQAESLLERGPFGIWEPVSGATIAPRDLDLVVTPLVAFDEQGHRIGMGGGYYDRCFAFLRHRQHWLRPKLFGVAFDCQKIEKISPNPWDIRLYRVISAAG